MAADSNAPPADLFNIWRQDYMVSPAAAAKDEAQRKANTFFDGVLPPFSNVYLPNKDVVVGETGISPAQAVQRRIQAGIKNVVRVNPLNPYATENKEGGNARDYSALNIPFAEEKRVAGAASGTARVVAKPAKPAARAQTNVGRGTVRR
ncbi:hypothetical protein T484DRAFT_1936459 [Baffinella frigidus]|nr:hypothetical protein T484DRAFT_1936459 [Cryptophyta sp. CCMP2293]